MARVTVEDCVLQVSNRFELVMMAAQRARDISAGSSLTVDRDNDKNPVVALREIADTSVELDGLRDSLVRGHQRHASIEEPDEEVIELMVGEEEWLQQTAVAEPQPDVPEVGDVDSVLEAGDVEADIDTEALDAAPDASADVDDVGDVDPIGTSGGDSDLADDVIDEDPEF